MMLQVRKFRIFNETCLSCKYEHTTSRSRRTRGEDRLMNSKACLSDKCSKYSLVNCHLNINCVTEYTILSANKPSVHQSLICS